MGHLTPAAWRLMSWYARLQRDHVNRRIVHVAARAHHARYHRTLCACPYRSTT